MKKKLEFDYCASCGDELDTGWECNGCGRDWMNYAYPWHRRIKHIIVAFFKRT